jgi:hypothetical protein
MHFLYRALRAIGFNKKYKKQVSRRKRIKKLLVVKNKHKFNRIKYSIAKRKSFLYKKKVYKEQLKINDWRLYKKLFIRLRLKKKRRKKKKNVIKL